MSDAPEGTVYRARSRVALTAPGVAVIGTAVPLLAGVLSVLVTGGLSWLFGVPLVLVAGYCAWEARPDARLVSLVVPPIVTLLTALLTVLMTDGYGGVLTFSLNVFRVLAGQAAPMLVLAEVLSGALVLLRRRGERPVSAGGPPPATP